MDEPVYCEKCEHGSGWNYCGLHSKTNKFTGVTECRGASRVANNEGQCPDYKEKVEQ